MEYDSEHYSLFVTYKINNCDHDGYCSDPSDFSSDITFETETVVIPENLPNEAINEYGVVDVSYLQSLNSEWARCSGSCGCCNTISTKTVISAVLVSSNMKNYYMAEDIEEVEEKANE
jgi:hypothetical protein